MLWSNNIPCLPPVRLSASPVGHLIMGIGREVLDYMFWAVWNVPGSCHFQLFHPAATWNLYRAGISTAFEFQGMILCCSSGSQSLSFDEKVIISSPISPLGQSFWFPLLTKYPPAMSAQRNKAVQTECQSSQKEKQGSARVLTPEMIWPWPSSSSWKPDPVLPEVSNKTLTGIGGVRTSPIVLSAWLLLCCCHYPWLVWALWALPASTNCTEQPPAIRRASGWCAELNCRHAHFPWILFLEFLSRSGAPKAKAAAVAFWETPAKSNISPPGEDNSHTVQHIRHWLSSFQQTPLNHTAHHLKQTLCKGL